MAEPDADWQMRWAAFTFVEELTTRHGDVVPWQELSRGFTFDGQRVTLIGQRGIWRARGWSLPISITTSWNDPYGDSPGDDGFLRYRYFGTDPMHADNVGLRRLMEQGRPLLYFRGVAKGMYAPVWPVVVVTDDAANLTVLLAAEDAETLAPGVGADVAAFARRRYATRLALARVHQAGFRQRVLAAYSKACTICRLRHMELLDAAHILGDRHPRGEPVVQNGLALCKIHHAAFDSNILGIRPDHVVEIRNDILDEHDGPMLRHGLQDLHGGRISLPRRRGDHPDRARLEERYEEFRSAG
jgi:putative restriction endonuclease